MPTLWLDTETYSETPIARGTYAYAADAEIMLVSYAVDDGPVEVWDVTAGSPIPASLAVWLEQADVIVRAHNAQFDRTVLRLGSLGLDIPVSRWECTMAQALSHSLPGKLAVLCELLRVPTKDAKLSTGADAIRLFCMPRPANMTLRRATRETHPAEWAEFVRYAGQDIVAMRECYRRMPRWNWTQRDVAQWRLDQEVNDRGFRVDLDLAQKAIDVCRTAASDNADQTDMLTDGAVTSVTQRDKLKRFLLEYGVDLPDLKAGTLERRITDPDLPWAVRELLALRMQGSKNSVSKYRTLARSASADGRLRGTIQFRGASRTGRDAGRVFQPQNLPRPTMQAAEIADWIGEVKAGNGEALAMLGYDNLACASNALRGCIVASPGRKLVVADYANIEGRVLAWLAGVEWKLEAFRAYDAGTGADLYRLAYAKSFQIHLDDVTKDNRQIGKVIELACGYQGAVGAFQSMAAIYRVEVDDDVALRSVKAWRRAHPEVVQLWYGLERVAKDALREPGKPATYGRLTACARGPWLMIKLPSGRYLCYPHARLEDGQITYAGQNQYSRKWERLNTYGGKLVENAVQAIAGDLLMAAKARVEAAGFPVVLPVHDELLTEPVDRPENNAQRLGAVMCELPPWAKGLPVTAAGFETLRYRKD